MQKSLKNLREDAEVDNQIFKIQEKHGVSRQEAVRMYYSGHRVQESSDILKPKDVRPTQTTNTAEKIRATRALKNEIADRLKKHNPKVKLTLVQKVLGKIVGEEKMPKTLKELRHYIEEGYKRSAAHAGRSISQSMGAIRDTSDNDPEYHKSEIEAIGRAMKTNPEWASSMLPQMQARLEHHQKRLAALSPVKEEYSESNPKIDLHHKNGKYLASTNFSPTVKHAVSRYEELHPEHKGMIKGFISK